jgi:D-alanyl-D-alanine carboxypeptidase/D-alanyl-D-alanine-endopeptidase (penicillin-binding protein 4)
VSALNLDSNELQITVTPGEVHGAPKIEVSPYFVVYERARTVPASGKLTLTVMREPNSMKLHLIGEIPVDAKPWSERIGIDDPAHYAAWTFRRMLEARGVKVHGAVQSSHRETEDFDRQPEDPRWKGVGAETARLEDEPLTSLTPPPLAEDVVTINKVSQNLHAQVLFRRVGHIEGTGSEEWAIDAEHKLFEKAGIPRAGYDFSDGSGMSTYNRVSPRAAVALLRWIDTQPWGPAWYASLPIAGKDGTLRRRFIGTPLEGNLAAKTGTLNATNALSGTFRTASGRRFTFAFFANDVPNGASALSVMEAVLLQIAAAN